MIMMMMMMMIRRVARLPELQHVDCLFSRDGDVLGLNGFLDSPCKNSELTTGLVTQLSAVT